MGTLHWLIIIVQIYKEKKDPLDFLFTVDDFDIDNKMNNSLKARRLFDFFLNSYVLWNEQNVEGCKREKQDLENDLCKYIPIYIISQK